MTISDLYAASMVVPDYINKLKGEKMTDKTDLIEIPNMNLPVPTELKQKLNDAFSGIYTKIEKEIADFVPDLTTDKGRKEIASLAYKIARTKTGLEAAAKNLTDDQREIIDAVNSERSAMKERLDKLRDAARKPLTDWEAAEAERQRVIDEGLATLRDIGRVDSLSDPDTIMTAIEVSKDTFNSIDWRDDEATAESLLETSINKFNADLTASRQRIADARELELLREKQRKEAEAQAEREAAEAAERDRQAEIEREQKRVEEARAQAAAEAEARIQAEKTAREEAEKAAIKAEEDRKADAQRAEDARIAEAKRAEEERAAAVLKAQEEERARLKRIADEEAEAAAKREADLAHRKKINNAVLIAIVKASDVSDDQAKMIIQAIAKREIPHVSISY